MSELIPFVKGESSRVAELDAISFVRKTGKAAAPVIFLWPPASPGAAVARFFLVCRLPVHAPALKLAPVEQLPGLLERLREPPGRLVEEHCVPSEQPRGVVGAEGPRLDLAELAEESPQPVVRGTWGYLVREELAVGAVDGSSSGAERGEGGLRCAWRRRRARGG